MDTAARYLVELTRPRDGWLALQGASSRARRAADALQQQGELVRFLRAIYVPEDDTCFFLIEAGSAELVDEVGERSGVDFRRITEPVDAARGWQRAVRPPAEAADTLAADHGPDAPDGTTLASDGFGMPSLFPRSTAAPAAVLAGGVSS
jgi:hypothetical protein